MEIIKKYPTKDWDWEYISMNPNLTITMIENNLDKPWDWDNGISKNSFNYENISLA